jgi:hypothetical protein
MKAQEPELNAIYPVKKCHYALQLADELLFAARTDDERLVALPETIPTFDKEQVFESDAAIGGIQ